MSNLPVLAASSPTAVPAKVYDKWWIHNISINAYDPNEDANAQVTLVKIATNSDGSAEMSQEFVTLSINNILSNSQSDPELSSIIVSLMNYIMKVGKEQGIVS